MDITAEMSGSQSQPPFLLRCPGMIVYPPLHPYLTGDSLTNWRVRRAVRQIFRIETPRMPHRLPIPAFSLFLLTSIAFGQQDYVGRYDVYTGFMYLKSSLINLNEPGFHTQIGMNPTRWYAVGFDFSTGSGDTSLTAPMLLSSVQQQIAAQLDPLKQAGLLPANYSPVVPVHSSTQSYALGPQLMIRKFRPVSIFLRPFELGAIHEKVTVHPTDTIGKALVAQLAPSGVKEDWTYFYGFAGGVDLNLTNHFGLRMQVDYVRDHLFSDLLPWRNTVRFSVGPSFRFGPNVPVK